VCKAGTAALLLLCAFLPALTVSATSVPAQERREPVLAGPPALVRSGRVTGPPLEQLAQFHRRLHELKAGRIKRLTILQIGDSHTEAEHFSGHLRALFQARFGNAGRGMLAPGSPVPYWRPYQVHAQQVGKWQIFTSNKTDHAPLPFGLSGFVIRSADHADLITLAADDDAGSFDTVEIGYYRRPDGGKIDVTVDGRPVGEIDTHGETYAMARRAYQLSPAGRRLEVRPHGDGGVDIADWAVYRNSRGIVLTSHGFSGAQVGIMDRWDWKTVASQLGELDPSLILLAFGTNEGYAPKSRLQNYETLLEKRIDALKQAAPNASIVLVSGPDANRIPKYCNGAANDRTPCKPLSAEEVAGYDGLLSASDRSLCRWHTPGSYELVRSAQRAVAHKTGVYFWDWLEVQGGMCGAYRWEQEGLVHKDRVHMKKDGYWRSADQLYAMLMRGFRGR
jgi:GDSL-like Lipase/Acylhydrolase family